MTRRGIALVTGASRGIGRAIAVALAQSGLDVAITARTVEPGESREHSSTIKRSDASPLPGSLRETAALIEECGAEALMIPADLTDESSVDAAARMLLEKWGTVDVVVHNARFIGAGHQDKLMDTPISAIRNHMQVNFFAPLQLNQRLIPSMAASGGGVIINLTSSCGFGDPLAGPGEGGWGISYGSSKAAIHRVAGILALELASDGILVINVDPGYIATERIAQDMAAFGFKPDGEPAEVIGAVVSWLAVNDGAAAYNGRTLFALEFCHEHNLLPGWPGPVDRPLNLRPDLCGAHLAGLAPGEMAGGGSTGR